MSKEYGLKFGTGSPTQYLGIAPTFIHFIRLDTAATLTPPGITQVIASVAAYKFNYTPSYPIYFVVDGATTSLGSDRYITGTLDPLQSDNERLDNMGSTISAIGLTLSGVGLTVSAIGVTIPALARGDSLIAMGATISGIAATLPVFALGASLSVMGDSLSVMGASLSVMGGSISVMGNSLAVMGGSLSVLGGSQIAIGDTLAGMAVTLSGMGLTMGGIGATIAQFGLVLGTTASSFGTVVTDPVDIIGYLKRLQELYEGQGLFTKQGAVWNAFDRTGGVTLMTRTLNSGALTTTKT